MKKNELLNKIKDVYKIEIGISKHYNEDGNEDISKVNLFILKDGKEITNNVFNILTLVNYYKYIEDKTIEKKEVDRNEIKLNLFYDFFSMFQTLNITFNEFLEENNIKKGDTPQEQLIFQYYKSFYKCGKEFALEFIEAFDNQDELQNVFKIFRELFD